MSRYFPATSVPGTKGDPLCALAPVIATTLASRLPEGRTTLAVPRSDRLHKPPRRGNKNSRRTARAGWELSTALGIGAGSSRAEGRSPSLTLEMYRAIPRSALWILPEAGHGPIFLDAAPAFTRAALAFLRGAAASRS